MKTLLTEKKQKHSIQLYASYYYIDENRIKSILCLKIFRLSELTTCSGRLIHSLIALVLKECDLTALLHLGRTIVLLCPLNRSLSRSWKRLTLFIFLNMLMRSHLNILCWCLLIPNIWLGSIGTFYFELFPFYRCLLET